MSSILIIQLERQDNRIKFPLPYDENEVHVFTLSDLQGAFPRATCLRYKDEGDDDMNHILCRDGIFCEPVDGWLKSGRTYFAVGYEKEYKSRVERFADYRDEVSKQRSRFTNTRKNVSDVGASMRNSHSGPSGNLHASSVFLYVGISTFKNGKCSKINRTSSQPGGLVYVGPFDKSTNTSDKIKEAAVLKFSQQNRLFRTAYGQNAKKFVLVYPDGTLVQQLPDEASDFSIQGYKNFLDPKMKYDRLRLYLCTKRDYDKETDNIEIFTESSSSGDEDLPKLSLSASAHRRTESNASCPNSTKETAENSNETDSTLPLEVEVRFIWNAHILTYIFPNDSTVLSLVEHLKTHPFMDLSKSLLLIHNGEAMNPDDKIFLYSHQNILEVEVQEIDDRNNWHEDGLQEDVNGSIPSAFNAPNACGHVLQPILRATLEKVQGVTEPTAVIKAFQEVFLQGRPLDIENEHTIIEGETSPIFISRDSIFNNAVEEIDYIQNIRFPLEVNFHGETARDFGGPRKEFLSKVNQEIKQVLLQEDDSKLILRKDEECIALKKFFYGGLLIGLSAIQGGPMADFLDSVMENTTDGEEKRQFVLGLQRTGLLQLMQAKPTLKFLFRPRASPDVNVNQLLHLLTVNFSSEGTSRRVQEETAYKQFIKYAREVYAGRRENITLKKILQFITGMPEVPLLGFSIHPSISFVDTVFPTASTCINSLYLPYQIDFDKMDLAFCNDYFGLE